MNKRVHEVLQGASLFLRENDCEEQIAQILLEHHLDVSRAQFFMMLQEECPEQVNKLFWADVHNHVDTKVPVQHLIGYAAFYGREFHVNKNVLIPRQETEEVVEKTLERARAIQKKKGHIHIADIGTGSGVIAATIALELPDVTVYAVDLSKEALRVAKDNIARLGADVTLYEGDFLTPLIEREIQIDLLVSNPPYIPYSESPNLSKTVVDYDPTLALFADHNGLFAYEQIIKATHRVIAPDGEIVFEIGYDQGESVPELIYQHFPKATVDTYKDLNQNDRIVTVRLNN